MAVRHGYGKIAGADALVFAYDTGDTRNSYRGEPTTNLYGNWNAYTGGSYEVLDNNTNYIKLLASAGTPWAGQFTAAVSAGTYTVSFQHRTDDGGSNNFTIDNDTQDDNIWNANITTTTEWQTYTSTKTHTGTGNHLLYFRRNGGTGNIYIRNVQLELKSHATPFIKGTRSATQGLLDLTGNTSIDLNTVSFDSNAQMTFDGTDDKAEVANFPHIWDGSFTVEAVVSWNDDSRSIILGNYNVGANDINFEKLTGRSLRFYWNRGERDITTPNNTVTTTGEYHHVVFTRGTTFRMYVNGSLITESSTDVGTDVTSTGSTFRIGGDTRDGTTIHNGDIPVVKAYNRALTAAEVKNNFNNYKGRFNL